MTPVELLDLPAFVRSLRGERQPSMLVHGSPLSGKTTFARKLATQAGWGYLDVLAAVAARPELAGHIDQLDIPTLRSLLLEAAAGVDALLVDELDFLFPLWGDLRPFQELVRTLSVPDRPVTFVFFVQSRAEWEGWGLMTAARENRVVELEKVKPAGG